MVSVNRTSFGHPFGETRTGRQPSNGQQTDGRWRRVGLDSSSTTFRKPCPPHVKGRRAEQTRRLIRPAPAVRFDSLLSSAERPVPRTRQEPRGLPPRLI